eukprot:TRINITY_DN531_c0_g1_i3.p1 TRINITY_DN531_c0_g1~~TRINITY_DN531_c0_g1_i3.p1  ORF type:complete len:602 (-),score=76.87 TRINITY_DN531_c0_g1_i3:530-2335(-)
MHSYTDTDEGRLHLGVSDPISITPPTAQDILSSEELDRVLGEYSLFESQEEAQKREVALGRLNLIVREWSKNISIKKGIPEDEAQNAVARIFTFGSYRLGVHGSGADIDTLCVSPRHIDRETDFFQTLCEILSKDPDVSELHPVPDAYVPVIKMKFNSIHMDLLFAQLSFYPTLPDSLELAEEINLKNIDEKSVLSLNGCRVTDSILQLVPNVANFRTALRCIKHWAKRRCIYSNAIGYPGGVAWALLTARICQLYPRASPSTLVSRFFMVYEQWKWPAPVLLSHISDGSLNLQMLVWNPKNPRDRKHLMPVITPAYPAINSLYNVSQSTLTVLKEEFARGMNITMNIGTKKATWHTLFEPSNFFSLYKYYVRIDIFAESPEDHRSWAGLVESRLRVLILRLEKLMLSTILKRIHPFPTGYENSEKHKYCTSFFMGLVVEVPKKNDANQNRTLVLASAISDFNKIISDWSQKKETMGVDITHVKRQNLPDFVFEGGVRPSPPPTTQRLKRTASAASLSSTSPNKVAATANTVRRLSSPPSTPSGTISVSPSPTPSALPLQIGQPLTNKRSNSGMFFLFHCFHSPHEKNLMKKTVKLAKIKF